MGKIKQLEAGKKKSVAYKQTRLRINNYIQEYNYVDCLSDFSPGRQCPF